MDDEGASELGTEIYELERDKLELGRRIGQGFYGEVLMGVVKHSDGTVETVAVKKLKSVALNNPESVDLQRECSIMKVSEPVFRMESTQVTIPFSLFNYSLQSLNHPKIVEIKAIVSVPSTMLVMEFMPMGSLLAYLRSDKDVGSISDKQLIKFATDVAEVSFTPVICSLELFHDWKCLLGHGVFRRESNCPPRPGRTKHLGCFRELGEDLRFWACSSHRKQWILCGPAKCSETTYALVRVYCLITFLAAKLLTNLLAIHL